MAKAIFHKNQRIYVKPVGTWAVIETVKPVWVKGVEEPVRIFYDAGLGRDFAAEDLAVEETSWREPDDAAPWRVLRARNKWQDGQDCTHHPSPGTHPVVVTDKQNWGGWRVPGAEYDRDPLRIEAQARLIATAPRMKALLKELVKLADDLNTDAPDALTALGREAASALREAEANAHATKTSPRASEKGKAAP
ncbi:MAG: hypothetical protein ACFB2Z_02565 [Maricaulaceae bacterium]